MIGIGFRRASSRSGSIAMPDRSNESDLGEDSALVTQAAFICDRSGDQETARKAISSDRRLVFLMRTEMRLKEKTHLPR